MTNKPDLESIEARVAAALESCYLHAKAPDHRYLTYKDHYAADLPQLIKAYREQQQALKEREECIEMLKEYFLRITDGCESVWLAHPQSKGIYSVDGDIACEALTKIADLKKRWAEK